MRLSEMKVGTSARIKTVKGEGVLRKRLLDLGLTPGTIVMVENRAHGRPDPAAFARI